MERQARRAHPPDRGNRAPGRLRERARRTSRDRPLDDTYLAEAQRTLPSKEPGGRACPNPTVVVWARHLRYAAERDPADLELLHREYEGLAHSLAGRLYRRGEPLEELRQVASEALVRALQSFDPARGIPFPGYATPTIIGRLKRHYRDHGWALRIGREQTRIHREATEARAELQVRLGRDPLDREIAEWVGHPVGDVRTAASVVRSRLTTSLDGVDASGTTVADRVGEVDPAIGLVERRVDLARAVAVLDHRSCELLWLYYWQRLSQSAIAERFGTNQMQVSRWLARALVQLRSTMTT